MKLTFLTGLAIATAPFFSNVADAAVTVNVVQVGSDVVMTSSGTFDPTGLGVTAPFEGYVIQGVSHSYRSVYASGAFLGLGDDVNLTGFSGLTGPSTFGPGGIFDASSSSGSGFAIDTGVFNNQITVYFLGVTVNGSLNLETSATATYLGQSFASLGLTPGQYVYTATNDTVTINIGSALAAVPEPGSWVLMLLGFGAIGFTLRRDRKAVFRSA